jgi:16S rRNA (guanine(966)-N(2))-methyltransferase RsmD
MRIITGKYKGRHFDIPRSFKARPTTDFAKENIFNVLAGYIDFDGAKALDLFSGTGSITLELLSRGCSRVVSIEQDRDHHRFICDCLKKLNDKQALPLRADVFRFLKSCHEQYDFIFADPPYALKELPQIPDLVIEKKLLKPDGIFVFEHGKDYDFSQHPYFREHRAYGSVNFSIFTSAAPASEADSPSVEP